MELRLSLEGENLGPWAKMKMDKLGSVVRESMREAAEELADVILFRGQEDIEEAGNFGGRWTEALHADVTETQRTIRLDVAMKPDGPPVIYWKVFEYGATLHPNTRKYMWLPFIGVDREEAGIDVWPSVYGMDKLDYFVSKAGNPILADKETGQPLYVGKSEVTIPKKFHLHEIIKEEAQKAKAVFRRILKENLSG